MVAARTLTRTEQEILDWARRESIRLIRYDGVSFGTGTIWKSNLSGGSMAHYHEQACANLECGGLMQDGMLAHYLGQAGASDVNVEARIEREPFDYRVGVTLDGAPIIPKS
jgi:hypothetical protein